MSHKPSIVLFRQDLRTDDHPALHAAVSKGGPIIPVYIWAPEEEGNWPPGAASRWWLHKSLKSLNEELKSLGLKLIIRQGSSLQNLLQIAKAAGADSIYWHRRYEPVSIQRDTHVKKELIQAGLNAFSFNGSLLFEPWTVATKQNTPFKVFTPFWNFCLKGNCVGKPLPRISHCKAFDANISSETIESLGLSPTIHWDSGLEAEWHPGSNNGLKALHHAIASVVAQYPDGRDRPDMDGVSKLSPYLHFGEISPRQVWHAVQDSFSANNPAADAFLRQIGWREFAHHLLYHFPHTTLEPLHPKFKEFPWKHDDNALKAWQKGKTGYPFVDAGMRQLWHTGWMHNRVRMIVASFLVKDLLLPWQEGAKWFWDTLVDADLANNTMGWQWTAGCGADAAPYFRIFNPITQGDKFDVSKEYVKKWVPELKNLPDKWLYRPWQAPEDVLRKAEVTLGVTYPYPIVDHAIARDRALAAFHAL